MIGNTISKKKVLYAITKSNWGGASKYVFELATSLPRERFDVVVAFGGNGILAQKLHEKNIRTISIDNLARDVAVQNDWSAFKKLLEILSIEQPNVLHLNSSKMAGLGALAGRIHNLKNFIRKIREEKNTKKVKIIYTSHGWPFNEDRPLLQKIVIKFLSWLTVVLSHKTIAVSDYEKKSMQTLPFTSKRLVTIYNGINPPHFLPKATAREMLLGGPKALAYGKYLWLGTIGELTGNKNYFSAINAVSYYNETHDTKIFYTIIGNGELQKPLEDFIEKSNLSDVIFMTSSDKHNFTPEVDLTLKAKASSLLPAFDAFLLPSKKEGLPYTLLEAGFAGTPSVSTPVGGIPEIIDGKETGVLSEDCGEQSLAQALSQIFENTSRATELGENLKKHVQNNFAFTKMLDSTIAIY